MYPLLSPEQRWIASQSFLSEKEPILLHSDDPLL
jgi:hypothetical protein